jgi:heme o synthase
MSSIATPAVATADLSLPARLGALLEMTKPGITRMVLVTTGAGFYLAAGSPFDFGLLLHTLSGTALAASGCNALNQWLERDADALMRRTQDRPLPSGRVRPSTAVAVAMTMAVLGLLQLQIFVNTATAAIVLLTLLSYLLVYTPMKRKTWFSTIVGAVPGALPILAGWTAGGGSLDVAGWALFAILFAWQMPHFFALAWMYRDDYARGGFKMLTVIDPSGRRAGVQVVVYGVILLAVSVVPTLVGLTGAWYMAGALVLGTGFLVMGTRLAMNRTDEMARRVFQVSIAYLPALLLLMVLDKV